MNRRQFMKTSFIFTSGIFVPKLGILRPNPVFARQSFSQRYDVSSEGLAFWLTMDDAASYGTTQDWYDLSGKGNTASQTTLANQPSIVGGNFKGKARNFDGIDDYLSTNSNLSSLDITGNMTVLFWLKTADIVAKTYIISKINSGDFSGWAIALNKDASDGDIVFWSSITAAWVDSTGVIVDGTWHHGTVVNNNGSISFHIDGSFDSRVVSNNPGSTTFPLVLGAFNGGSNFFTGTATGYMIFSRALTAAEIKRIYDKDRNNFNK